MAPSPGQATSYTSFWKVAAQPSGPDLGLTNQINVGTRFRVNEPGQIVGVRYFDLGTGSGDATGQLYDANGDRLAETSFSGRSAGWQQATFKAPVEVAAGTEVVAAVYLPRGQWAYSLRQLGHHGVQRGALTALNGQYLYWAGEHFPSMVTTDSLFVDLLFEPDAPDDPDVPATTPPTTAPTTTAPPTTAPPTTAPPTTVAPTTAPPTTTAPTTAAPTTTAPPTTAAPTTAPPTTHKPTAAPTVKPTTAKPTTSAPTTSEPTTTPPAVTPTKPKPTADDDSAGSGAEHPIGACALKPSASNTGASGSRSSSGVTSVSKNGARLENVNVSGSLMVTGDNVVVRNVSVTGSIVVRGSSGVVLDHVTARGIAISGAQNTTVQYANVSGGNDAIHVTSDTGPVRGVTLQYNYIHHPNPSPGAHYDGTQVRGVDGMKILCSTYELGPWESTYNAAIYLEKAQGGDHNVLVANNWLDGGGYTVYVNATGLTVTGNRIGQMAHWGPCRNLGGSFVSSGNVWDASGAHINMCGEG